MMRVFVEGIGLLGPGLPGWAAARPVLCGAAPFLPDDVVLPPILRLPAAERRRAGGTVRLAMSVGLEALAQAERDPGDMATVFSSSGGDGETVHAILSVLATEAREISPTRFHNSVHNAPSGYWALACGATAPSTSLCAFDGSFAIGLLDAAAQCVVDRRPVTLIAHDTPYPEPLHSARPISTVFGVALVLTPTRTPHSLAEIFLRFRQERAPGPAMASFGLETLRRSNPAARSLPLLAALAWDGGEVVIEGIPGAVLDVAVGMS